MKYTTIRIEGSIFSADILGKIQQGELGGQLPKDFGLDGNIKVKDEIARSWADAKDLWHVFSHRMERVKEGESGTSETRKFFMVPFLSLLGFDAELAKAEEVNGKSYAISHRAINRDGFPTYIMGFNDSLDKRRDVSGPRMDRSHSRIIECLGKTGKLTDQEFIELRNSSK